MIANRKLLIHGIDAKAWARRHDIEPFTSACHRCGTVQTTSIPFAEGNLRGLVAPPCKCTDPNVRPPYCVVRDPRFGDLFTGIGRLP